jgi:phosphate-selective porin OprO and OprP
VHPRHNFDPSNGAWGALQLLARYSQLRVDPRAFANGLVTSTANQQAAAVTIGADWYPTAYIKYYATFERTSLTRGAAPRRENVVMFRAQLAF